MIFYSIALYLRNNGFRSYYTSYVSAYLFNRRNESLVASCSTCMLLSARYSSCQLVILPVNLLAILPYMASISASRAQSFLRVYFFMGLCRTYTMYFILLDLFALVIIVVRRLFRFAFHLL